jgi:hypothetical protein
MQEMSVAVAHLYEADGKKSNKINIYCLTLWGDRRLINSSLSGYLGTQNRKIYFEINDDRQIEGCRDH